MIPKEERTHVPLDKFKLACGAPRIGADAELLVREAPTCPGCRKGLRARDNVGRVVSEAVERLPGRWS